MNKKISTSASKVPKVRKPSATKKRQTKKKQVGPTTALSCGTNIVNKSLAAVMSKRARMQAEVGKLHDAALTEWVKKGANKADVKNLPWQASQAAAYLFNTLNVHPFDAQTSVGAGRIDIVAKHIVSGKIVIVDLKCPMGSPASYLGKYHSVKKNTTTWLRGFSSLKNTVHNNHQVQLATYRLGLQKKLNLPYIPDAYAIYAFASPFRDVHSVRSDDAFLLNKDIQALAQ